MECNGQCHYHDDGTTFWGVDRNDASMAARLAMGPGKGTN